MKNSWSSSIHLLTLTLSRALHPSSSSRCALIIQHLRPWGHAIFTTQVYKWTKNSLCFPKIRIDWLNDHPTPEATPSGSLGLLAEQSSKNRKMRGGCTGQSLSAQTFSSALWLFVTTAYALPNEDLMNDFLSFLPPKIISIARGGQEHTYALSSAALHFSQADSCTDFQQFSVLYRNFSAPNQSQHLNFQLWIALTST